MSPQTACSRLEPAAEVRTRTDDRGFLKSRTVEDAAGPWRSVRIAAHVEEDPLRESGLVDAAQELLGHDLVGVAVVDRKRSGNGRERGEFFHDAVPQSRRQSVNLPVTAAAAAIWGLTRWVRAPRPWRPSKLRFVVEAQRTPASRMSSFMQRQSEQPLLSPLETRVAKDLRQALLFSPAAHLHGARHHLGANARRHMPPFENGRGCAQIRQARIGAGSDENVLNRHAFEHHAGLKSLIGKAALGGRPRNRILKVVRRRKRLVDRRTLVRARSPGDHGLDGRGIQDNRAVICRAFVRRKRSPVGARGLEPGSREIRRMRFNPGRRLSVGCDQRTAGSRLNGQIAERHAPFDRQGIDSLSLVLDDMAERPSGTDLAKHRERKILGRRALGEPCLRCG